MGSCAHCAPIFSPARAPATELPGVRAEGIAFLGRALRDLEVDVKGVPTASALRYARQSRTEARQGDWWRRSERDPGRTGRASMPSSTALREDEPQGGGYRRRGASRSSALLHYPGFDHLLERVPFSLRMRTPTTRRRQHRSRPPGLAGTGTPRGITLSRFCPGHRCHHPPPHDAIPLKGFDFQV